MVTNLKLKVEEKEGEMDMCQAIEEMMNDSFNDGFNNGFNDGCDNKGVQVFLNCKNRGMSTEEAQAIAEISDKLVEIALEKNNTF